MKNKPFFLLLLALLLVILSLGYNFKPPLVHAFERTPYGDFEYGEMVRITGDLTAAGVDWGDETAVIAKNLRNIESVVPGVNFSTPYYEVMSFVIYNHAKGITSGDRGYDLIPFDENIVKDQVRKFSGNPDYVWDTIQTRSDARYVITNLRTFSKSEWVNVAVIRNLSGGGGTPIIPLNNHSNKEWGYYHSGQLDKFDFSKPINKSTHIITAWPSINEFRTYP